MSNPTSSEEHLSGFASIPTDEDKIEEQQLEINGGKMEIDDQQLEIDGEKVRVDEQQLEIHGHKIEIADQPLELDGDKIEIDEQILEIDGQEIQIDKQTLEINKQKIQIEDTLNRNEQRIAIDDQSIVKHEMDGEKLEIDGEILKLEHQSEEMSEDTKPPLFLNLSPLENSTTIVIQQVKSTNMTYVEKSHTGLDLEYNRPLLIGKPLKTYSSNKNANRIMTSTIIASVPQIKFTDVTEQLTPETPQLITPKIESLTPAKPKKANVRTYGKIKNKPDDDSSTISKHTMPKKIKHSEPCMPSRKKRRLVVDNFKVIPNSEFKQQLQNTGDIVQTKTDIAPATKKAMHFLTYGGVGKFFAYPGRKILSVPLAKLFFSHLTVTTEIRPTVMVDGQVAPLDPELKTPLSEASKSEVTSKVVSYMGPHLYNDSLAKRAANSFDHLIKGMNVCRTKKSYEETRKHREYRKCPIEQIQSFGSNISYEGEKMVSNVDKFIKVENISSNEEKPDNVQTEIGNVCNLVDEEQLDTEVTVCLEKATDSSIELPGDYVVRPMDFYFKTATSENDASPVKIELIKHVESEQPEEAFVYDVTSENPAVLFGENSKNIDTFVGSGSQSVFLCNNNETSEQVASQSNLEMLLAAAEQHPELDVGHDVEVTTMDLQEFQSDDPNGDSKNGIVYCTAESDAEGGLVIVDSSGRRYTVSSNTTGLTLWPEST